MDRTTLNNKLKHNVLVIEFRRRTPPVGRLRRMICTKSEDILSSTQGSINLNFRPPKHGGPKFDEAKVNVCIVWDILMQDYRIVPCESAHILREIPVSRFWAYYNRYIFPMSQREKLRYMNK